MRVLILPGSTRVAIEILRSLRLVRQLNIYGIGSDLDVLKQLPYDGYYYLENINLESLSQLRTFLAQNTFDLVYITHDAWLLLLKDYSEIENSPLTISNPFSVEISSFKTLTYELFRDLVRVPNVFNSMSEIKNYPIYAKPNRGQGRKGHFLVQNQSELQSLKLMHRDDIVLCEFLPGNEFTVDCFSDGESKPIFVGSRKRLNYIDGLAKETHATPSCEWVIKWAELFSSELRIKGAWFFQYKFDDTGQPVLLEIGLRIAGASGLARLKGVNLSLLNLYLFTDPNTSLAIYGQENQARISGNGIFNLGFEFNAIYVDLDDTLLVRDSLNIPLLHYLRNSSKKGVSLRILTRNADALRVVSHISNQVPIENIHIVPNSDRKSDYVDTNDKFLFIDDSHRERMDIKQTFKDQALVLDPSFCWQHNFI